jgi:hypothetical protein
LYHFAVAGAACGAAKADTANATIAKEKDFMVANVIFYGRF